VNQLDESEKNGKDMVAAVRWSGWPKGTVCDLIDFDESGVVTPGGYDSIRLREIYLLRSPAGEKVNGEDDQFRG
jgi:hypothetical protein